MLATTRPELGETGISEPRPSRAGDALVAFCVVWLCMACSHSWAEPCARVTGGSLAFANAGEKSSDPKKSPIGRNPRPADVQTAEIGCSEAALFASGVADEPFEPRHVGDPEVATLAAQ